MLLDHTTRNHVEELASRIELQVKKDAKVYGRKNFTKIDVLAGFIDYMEQKLKYDVWGAVKKDVGFRLPHELNGSANCGERAFLLYCTARVLGLKNIKFFLSKNYEYIGMNHAFILFDNKDFTYFADSNEDVTSNFEITPRRIRIRDDLISHSGLQSLSESELEHFISCLREKDSIIKLFKHGQYLAQKKTSKNVSEVFVKINEKRSPHTLPEYKKPTLEVILISEEPYSTNTAVVLLYPLLSPEVGPKVVQFYDLADIYWGRIEGNNLVDIIDFGTENEVPTFRSADIALTSDELDAVVAYLDYRKNIEKKAEKNHKNPDKTYLLPKRKRDVVSRLIDERRKLELAGKKDDAKEKFKLIEEWEDIHDKGNTYYHRRSDFSQSTLWPYERSNLREILLSSQRRHGWETKLMVRYVKKRHMPTMEQMLEENGYKIRTVREKVAAALQH